MIDARNRELELFSDLKDEQLLGTQQHFLEPPIWEVGHVGWFQEYWILRNLDRAKPVLANSDSMYDAFNVSYKLRWDHAFPSREETLAYLRTVLDRCVERLRSKELTEEEIYHYRLCINHEDMHAESLTLIRQSLAYPCPKLSGNPTPVPLDLSFAPHDVEVPGGTHDLGANRDEAFVLDNEKWAHPVEVEPYRISATPVTNEEFRTFVEAGGYRTRKYWGKSGWEWRRREKAEHPLFWSQGPGGEWRQKKFDGDVPLEPHHPVVHVNWCEAQAYCAWAGRRLPTEAEWERAASGESNADGRKQKFPWGDNPPTPETANLDSAHLDCVDVRAFPAGDSPFGCRQMIGNVWEWTADALQPYPEFEPDPYREYSEPYFGRKKVLRGGGWATRSRLIRTTWRNFYMRHRRNIFAGFRTVAL